MCKVSVSRKPEVKTYILEILSKVGNHWLYHNKKNYARYSIKSGQGTYFINNQTLKKNSFLKLEKKQLI